MTQELIPQAHFEKTPVMGSYFLTDSKLDKMTRGTVGGINELLTNLVHQNQQLTFDIEHKPKQHGTQINWRPL